MPADTVKGEDGGATAEVNAASQPRGKFKVLAEGGISVGMGDTSVTAKRGATVELEGPVIRALLADGAIEEA